MRVRGGAKNRKARLPARDADKHTCAELYALTCRHTRGLKRPKWPSKSWRLRYNYNPTYFREEWMERGKHWLWFYSSEAKHKHWSLYWALTTSLSDTVSRYIFLDFMRKKNKSKGGESARESCVQATNENVTTSRSTWDGQPRTSALVAQEFVVVFRLPGRGRRHSGCHTRPY